LSTTNLVVSSLFPSQVREKIYEQTENAKFPKKEWGRSPGNADEKARNFIESTDDAAVNARPIAHLYEYTTIMFADLAGFTQWSATRTPVEVFELLESLYQNFDRIASRRRVFKVETIVRTQRSFLCRDSYPRLVSNYDLLLVLFQGDCYVAVTGLPEPQEEHAVILTKFARDCIEKTNVVTKELVETLGPGTADLQLRVGLHSGTVTGGVLRGQKSRFQLFGDSMNTAARMESNGCPGRIHASEATAKALIAKGKMSWVTPREDTIVVKGKGEMKTFWIAPRESTEIASVLSSKEGVVSSGSWDEEANNEEPRSSLTPAIDNDGKTLHRSQSIEL
jgi:class 3 adenylate cyclase